MPTTTNPVQALSEGVAILSAALEPHGFIFELGPSGSSSGGAFASGRFVSGDRSIEVHFRHGLGLVTYHWGAAEIDHESYLRYSGNWGANKFPAFGQSSAESFAALASDLSAFFPEFLAGGSGQFKAVVAARQANPGRFKGFAAIGKR